MPNPILGQPSSRRPSVLSCNASVATNNHIATGIGIQLLKHGANAAEAAVGIAAALNVMDPGNTGLGGDCFVLFYDSKTKSVKGINGSGRSSSQLTWDVLAENGISAEHGHRQIPYDSAFSVTVPGAAAAWIDAVEIFGSGTISMAHILEPAIHLAENGFPTHELTAYCQQENSSALRETEFSSGEDFLINGKTPSQGQVMTNPKLANVFRTLGSQGKKGFYEGNIAKSIVTTVVESGGCMLMEDLKNHSSTVVDPISTTYRGYRVWEIPPNGQGLIALMGLNILEGFDVTGEERMSASYLHKLIEATQLAFADGAEYIADPMKADIPLKTLLSKEHASIRRNLIDPSVAATSEYKPSKIKVGEDTVYFSVVDSQGNACSFINSIYRHFGSGLVPRDTGFALQCRGSNFSLDPNHRNSVGPGKRPYHTIIPGMVTHEDTHALYACFGVMGGFMQPQGHIQVLTSLIDYNMEPQESICLPRYCIDHFAGVVYVESTLEKEVVDELRQLGHNIVVLEGGQRTMFGGAQLVQVRFDSCGRRVLWAGSESRQDGCALGY